MLIHSEEMLVAAMNEVIKRDKAKGLNHKIGRFQGYDKDGNACILLNDYLFDEALKYLESEKGS